MLHQRGFAHGILLLLLLAGVVLGVYLVQTKTNLFSKAASQQPMIVALDDQDQPLPIDNQKEMVTITKPHVKLALYPPDKTKPNIINTSNVLYQVLLVSTGRDLLSRKCSVDSGGTVEWSKCTQWIQTWTDSIRSAPDNKYLSFDALVLPAEKPVVYQSFLAENGQDGYVRNCTLEERSFGVVFDQCSSWSPVDFRNLRNIGDEKYRSLNSYLIEESSKTVLKQSLVGESGQEGYTRTCPVDMSGTPRIEWQNCSVWSTVDFKNLQGQGNESYNSVNNFITFNDQQKTLNQSLLDASGKIGYARSCPINDAGILWAECKGWSPVEMSSLQGKGNESYRSITNFLVTFKNEIVQPKVTFTHYKISEFKEDFNKLQALAIEEPKLTLRHHFSNIKPGKRTIYVRFYYSDGTFEDGSLDLWQATDKIYYFLPKLINPKVNGDFSGGSTTYYDVEGATAEELIADLNRKGPRYGIEQKIAWGGMHYYYSWLWSNSCQVSISLEISFIMPRWNAPADAPEVLKQEWGAFYTSLEEHEKGHAIIASNGLSALQSALNGTCNNSVGYQIVDTIIRSQEDYDRNTTHQISP